MDKNTMIEPKIQFILDEFEKVRFGSIRPSEMELLLFYILVYHKNDLDKSVFELANKYYITETKASKMLVEISKRYKKDSSANNSIIKDIAERIFEGKGEYRQNITIIEDTVSFVIPNPIEHRAMREELEKCQIANLYTGNNKNFKLSKADLLCFFSKYYDEIAAKIKENLGQQYKQDKDYQALFEKSKPVPARIHDLIKNNSDLILSAFKLVKTA